MKNTRIILCGAQGTGKTTVLKHYEKQGMNVITEVIRNLAKEGVKINEDGDKEGQKTIFNKYKQLLNNKKSYISDRGLFDVVSYTFYLALQNKLDKKFAESQYKQIITFINKNPDIIYCYFPIEFDVVDDGVRSTDENFRKEIDYIIKETMDSMKIKYITVTGTVEDRIKIIDEAINKTMLMA